MPRACCQSNFQVGLIRQPIATQSRWPYRRHHFLVLITDHGSFYRTSSVCPPAGPLHLPQKSLLKKLERNIFPQDEQCIVHWDFFEVTVASLFSPLVFEALLLFTLALHTIVLAAARKLQHTVHPPLYIFIRVTAAH